MEVEYIKGLGCPVNIILGKEATAITITDAKQLQAKLAQVIEQAENEPGPELSEFEKRIRFTIDEVVDGRYNADNIEDVKGIAKGLLELAREQFIKDGYVIEKKAFHDAVENISDKNLAEMSVEYSLHCKIEDGTRHAIMNWEAFQKVAQKFIDVGKADALKDLPRWIDNWDSLRPYKNISGLQYIVLNGKAMNVSGLSKLPGFKEDEK